MFQLGSVGHLMCSCAGMGGIHQSAIKVAMYFLVPCNVSNTILMG